MNKAGIEKILPHRPPMLLVDDAELTDDGGAVGHYTVRGDESFKRAFSGIRLCPA